MSLEIIFSLVVVLLAVGAIFLAFHLGKLQAATKSSTQTAQIAFGAALWAVTEAKALKDGVIIQRTIEKMHIVDKKDEASLSAEAKEMTEAMEAAVEGLSVKRNKIVGRELDPNDLV